MPSRTSKATTLRSLSAGRPPHLSSKSTSTSSPFTTATLSSRATRRIIRAHHTLSAAAARARASGDISRAEHLAAGLDLPKYQAASLLGQRPDRGGDASRVLVAWLRELLDGDKDEDADSAAGKSGRRKDRELRLLDVGALSTRNACARARMFEVVERIDLNAQAEGILKQDFLQRPAPAGEAGGGDEEGRFDVLPLSLVLNYVPDPAQRGDMLRHTTRFFRQSAEERGARQEVEKEQREWPFPSLFLVLPLPCVSNSRYFDDDRLHGIMERLGYTLLRRKQSAKLVYYLWRWNGEAAMADDGREGVGKAWVKGAEGRARMNNFRVELRPRTA